MNATRTAAVAAVLAAAAVVPAGSAQAPAAPVTPVTPVAAARVADVAAPPAPGHPHDHGTHRHAAPAKRVAPKPAAAPKPAPAPKPTGTAPVWDGRAFATPEATMRFLVRAYNSHADGQLKHVTTPAARSHLIAMRDYAPAMRLKACTRLETGAYDCEFTHNVAETGRWDGWATLHVAPAAKPGWYATVLADCGDGEEA